MELDRLLEDQRWLSDLARSLVADPGQADDACQEAWLAAHRRLPGMQPTRAWLITALRRVVKGQRRSEARRARRELAAAAGESLPSTDELVARSEAQQLAARAVLALEEPFRTTLLLHYQEGLPSAEIATRQDCPVDTVRWRVRKGLAILRLRLERENGADWRALLLVAVPGSIPSGGLTASPSVVPGIAACGVVVMSAKWLWIGLVGIAILIASMAGGGLFSSGAEEPVDSLPVGSAAARSEATVEKQPATRSVEGGRVLLATKPERPEVETLACRIVGRVVDTDARSLRGVRIRASSHKLWEEETKTDATGAFSLKTPIQTRREVWISVEYDAYHTRKVFSLGTARRCEGSALMAGERVFEDFVLEPAGEIEGLVVDASGAPIENCLVMLRRSNNGVEPERPTFSGADGRFAIPHNRPGRFTLETQSYGHRALSMSVEVNAGRTTGSLLLKLAVGSQVSGIVVDEGGQPVAGIGVRARGFMYGWGTKSGSDGRFRLFLAKDRLATVVLESQRVELVSSLTNYAPGSTDVRLVVRSLGRAMTLQVIDASTRKPVSRYGVRVMPHAGPGGDFSQQIARGGEPSEEERRLGEAKIIARSSIDALSIVARGYRTAEVAVRFDAGREDLQTIELSPGGGVRGRIMRDGKPVAGARVELRPGRFAMHTVVGDSEPQPDNPDAVAGSGLILLYELTALSPRVPTWSYSRYGLNRGATHKSKTDADGRFWFATADDLHYSLSASDGEGADLVFSPIRVKSGVGQDLGELDMPRTVRLSGQIRLTEPGPLAGHRVVLVDRPGKGLVTGANGEFVFEDVAPGDHYLRFAAGEGVVCDSTMFFLRVGLSGVEGLVLPIQNATTTLVTLEVRTRLSLKHATLRFVEVADVTAVHRVFRSFSSTGKLSAAVKSFGAVWPELVVGSRTYRLGDSPVVLRPGGRVDMVHDVSAGNLVISCSGGWPKSGRVNLVLRGEKGREISASAVFVNHGLDARKTVDVVFVAPQLKFRNLPAGEFLAVIECLDSGGQWLWGHEAKVVIIDGRGVGIVVP